MIASLVEPNKDMDSMETKCMNSNRTIQVDGMDIQFQEIRCRLLC